MASDSFTLSRRSAFPVARRRLPLAVPTLALTASVLLVACGGQPQGQGAGGPPGGGMPPAEVGVLQVEPGALPLVTELPGRLEASRVAQVRARASGILQTRLFREGSDVRAGQPLFRIDPAPLDAALASARAQQARAEAQRAQARALLARYTPLLQDRAISQQDFDNAQIAVQQAEADVALAQAAVQTASIQRAYADVTSPISGRIGRALVTEGALVGQGDATALAVVQQIDPLYVNFTQPANEALRLARAVEAGQLANARGAGEVEVLLDDGTAHPHKGKLLFSDLTVDTTSGQVTLRAEVPNPGGRLLPGLFVRVRLAQAEASNAVALPQQAVQRTPQGDHVMVVAADGQVSQRSVQLGNQQGGRWVVLSGLQAGEQVMVDGFQKLRGNAPVKPVPWQAPGSAAAANPANAPAQPEAAKR